MKRIVALLMVVAFAGCLDDGNPSGEPAEEPLPPRAVQPEDPIPVGAGHDHADVSQHKFLWNYEATAYDNLLQNDVDTAGLHALDRAGDLLVGSTYGAHAISVNGGITVWDISDPEQPQQLGRFVVPGDVGGDRSVAVTQDGAYVVLGTETTSCAGHVNPLGAAINAFLFDIRDPTNIQVADVLTVAGGRSAVADSPGSVHSVSVHHIHGDDYTVLFGDVYKIARTETGASFESVGFDIPTSHDHYVRDTPWGDTWVLTTSAPGLSVYNFTDPYNPVLIGTWEMDRLAPGATTHYTHTADVAFLDGEIIMVVTAEDWEDHVSPMWVINATALSTRPTEPVHLQTHGWWWNPSDVHADGLRFSLHNPRFSDDGIFTIASYHAGVWQLDLRRPDQWVEPEPIAYMVYAEGDPTDFKDPIQEAQTCGFIQLPLDAPTIFDVELGDGGVVYAADPWMGLYTFAPTADHPVYGANASDR